MESNPLQTLLEQRSADGVYDSTSEFTIDSLKARQKLAENRLPLPGLWLVKLVQAGVVVDAEEIGITFGRRSVSFSLRCREQDWQPRQMVSALLSGLVPSDPFLFHLLAGLHGSLYDDTLDATLTIAVPGSEFEITFSAGSTRIAERETAASELSALTFTTSRPRRLPSFKRATFMPLGHLIRRTADEFIAVLSYCWPCPVPLKVDARLLDHRYRDALGFSETSIMNATRQFAITSPMQPLPVLLTRTRLRAAVSGPGLCILWPTETGGYDTFSRNGRFFRAKKKVHFEETWISEDVRDEEPADGFVLLTFSHEMASRVEFVCDGVVCGFHPLPWQIKPITLLGMPVPQNNLRLGLRAVIPVSREDLDLSHFAVREPEQLLERRFPDLREQILATVDLCHEHSAEFRLVFAPRPDSWMGKVGSAVLGTMSSLHPAIPPLVKSSLQGGLDSLKESLESQG